MAEHCDQTPELCEVIQRVEDAIKDCLRQHNIDPSFGNTAGMVSTTQIRNNMIRSEYNQRRGYGEMGIDIIFDLWIKYPEIEVTTIKEIIKNHR